MTTPTNPSVTHDLRLAARQGLLPTTDSGILAGFGNMFGKEMGEWLASNRWLVHSLIWVTLIGGFIAFILFGVPAIDQQEGPVGPQEIKMMGYTLFYAFAAQLGMIGVVILAQDEIIREKQSGTAAWILTKPISRSAFVLSKLASNIIGILIFILALPALVSYAEIYLASGQGMAILPFLSGLGPVFLALLFYLTLTIMLGVLFEQRGGVLGIALGLMFGTLILQNFLPQIAYVLPTNPQDIGLALSQGQPLPAVAVSQLVATGAWSILFTVIALWRFQHIEF